METIEKLDPEFKAKWVAALRSGEYQQGTGELYCNGKYCCLGVACKVAGIGFNYNNLPKPLDMVYESSYQIATKLVHMNDGWCEDQKSFAEIADYIEENL